MIFFRRFSFTSYVAATPAIPAPRSRSLEVLAEQRAQVVAAEQRIVIVKEQE